MTQEDELESLIGYTPTGAGEFEEPVKDDRLTHRQHSLEAMTDPKQIRAWMESTRKIPLDQVDEYMVARTYPLALWQFRKSALEGDLKATNAMKAWIEWATPIKNKQKPKEEKTASKGSIAFLPREPRDEKFEDDE